MSRLTKSCPESPARVWSSQSLCTYKLISANNFWLVWSLVKSMRTLKLNPTTQSAVAGMLVSNLFVIVTRGGANLSLIKLDKISKLKFLIFLSIYRDFL